jgi:hypothetical protein
MSTQINSLAEGRAWINRLEEELVLLVSDLVTFQDQLSPVSQSALKYTAMITEETIQRLELEIKMFEE